MRSIRPPALFELRAHQWRNAVDSHHTPFSGSPQFSKQARLARPVDIPNWPAEPKLACVDDEARLRTACYGAAAPLLLHFERGDGSEMFSCERTTRTGFEVTLKLNG